MVEQTKKQETQKNNTDILNKLISSKEIEGCSTRTLNYYKDNIIKMLDTINLPIDEITTEILRSYLADYKSNSNAGMVTIDNIRRTLSSFFAWLENMRIDIYMSFMLNYKFNYLPISYKTPKILLLF